LTKTIVIGELPVVSKVPSQVQYDNLLKGVAVQDLTPQIYSRFKLPDKMSGVIVSNVSSDSPASLLLVQGDVIMEINREKITNTEDYETIVSQLKPDEDILLLIFRNGSSLFVTLSAKE
jgi:serine protease Do